MKKLIAFTVILGCIILTLASCGGGGGSKQVPVYQGMTISSAGRSANAHTLPSLWAGTNNGNGNDGDSGNHYGQYKGDHDGRNDQIDEENPFPDNSAGENIEEEIESSLNVTGPMHDIYYATPNEDIYIYIHIDNPDSFEIMSFTLNGKKYSSYMFEDGSDMETIILKYNVGNTSGYVEYTIDAIKYIDGTEIKDVIIDGDKTVRAGIKTENQVTASIGNLSIGTNSISFNADIKDNDGLIAFVNGTIKAVIYDGESIIAEKDLTLGKNSVSFEGLKTNTLYQYAVVGYYDDLSGGGFGMYILHKDAFYTDSVVLFSDITVGQENISFGFSWHNDRQDKSLTSLKLYKDGSLVKELDTKATSIDGLLSANTYSLVASYSNLGNTESISIEFTTLAKAEPSISIINPSSTQDSISFEVEETDADNVGSISKIELIDKNGKVVATNTSVKDFTGLLSNNEYTIKVTYTYDLNDGNGIIIKIVECPYVTLITPINISSIDILNSKNPKIGEYIHLNVFFNNPDDIEITNIAINDQLVEVVGGNLIDNAIVKFIPKNFDGGLYTVYITSVNYTSHGFDLNQKLSADVSDEIVILGQIDIADILFDNGLNYCKSENDDGNIDIIFNNKTGYSITEISINGSVYTEFDYENDKIKLSVPLWPGLNKIYIDYFEYQYNDISSLKTSDNIYYLFKANEIIEVTNGEQFEESIADTNVLMIKNDIDFSKVQHKTVDFNGFIIGNNCELKNFTYVSEDSNDRFVGLFATNNGIISDLFVTNTYLSVKTITYVDGGIICASNGGIINNVSVSGTLSIQSSEADVNAGGICAYNGGIIYNCQSNVKISAIGSKDNLTGHVGVGGLCGFNSGTISCCYSQSDVYSSLNPGTNIGTGGFVGFNYSLIENSACYSTATATAGEFGDFVGHNRGVITNCKFVGSNNSWGNDYDYQTSIEMLNSKDLYISVLGWSEDVWDFSDLDVENGKYPKLR